MSKEHKDNEISKLNNEITKLTNKINTLSNKHKDIKTEYTDYKKKVKDNEIIERKIDNNKISMSRFSIDIKNKQDYKKKVEIRTFDFDTTNINNEYEKQKTLYISLSEKLEKALEKLKIYDITSKMLSEEGIKAYFFKRLIPILNLKIKEYLDLFELPIKIEFSETMEENISYDLGGDKHISYMAFSEGEKKRIDIAILLSFISITKSISNWNCNVILFDEVLDNATDADGLEKLLGSIKDMTRKDKKLCSYVISHRDTNEHIYDRKIVVEKKNSFSILKSV